PAKFGPMEGLAGRSVGCDNCFKMRLQPWGLATPGASMKYVDYYQVLGVERNASQAEIKKAYRKLAHEHHPDVASHAGAEDRFKDIAEAYATLKDPEKRAAYDALGSRPQGEEFVPPREWREYFHESPNDFADVDLADLLAAFAAARHGGGRTQQSNRMHGQDFDIE